MTVLRNVFLLPGMGGDSTMYCHEAWHEISGACFLDWPEYSGEESIGDIADTVIAQAGISDGDVLIGSSLGGIVACEIAGKCAIGGLILVGSAVRQDEISELLALLHPLARLAPIEFIQAAAGKIPNDLTRMFSHAQAPFIRATCRAIFEWEGLRESSLAPIRIHGRRDRVIPLPPHVDLILDGGHLLAVTHARECVDYIKKSRLL